MLASTTQYQAFLTTDDYDLSEWLTLQALKTAQLCGYARSRSNYGQPSLGEDNAFEINHWQNATHPSLRSIISVIRARGEPDFLRHLRTVEERPEFRRPDTSARSDEWSENQQPRSTIHPMVHYGTIISGNSVIKSKARRDYLRKRYGGIAVEMEAADIMTRIPAAVIRGISDFADSSKNDCRQPYAAITAAAYSKEVLTKLSSEARGSCPGPRSAPYTNQDARLAQVLPERWTFVGRETELSYLDEELGLRAQQPLQKSIVAVWGVIGVGKSQLASRFVHQQRSKHPKREIFWVNGETQAFEQSVAIMLNEDIQFSEQAQPKSPQKEGLGLVHKFFTKLSQSKDQRWLLVFDGLKEKTSSNSPNRMPFSVHGLIRSLKRGYILLTTRRRDVIEEYHPNCELKGLTVENAANLLRSRVGARLIEAGIEELVRFFKGHPLTLRLAASVISRHRQTAVKYLEKWKNHEIDENPTEISKFISLSTEQALCYLNYQDLWYELCFGAVEETYPIWLRDLSKEQKSFRSICPILADLSFLELKHTADGDQFWEIHPAIQAVARQITNTNEQEYIRCAISLVAAQVPQSYEDGSWKKIGRLEPHATRCWTLGRLFRHTGQFDQASLIYRMIEKALDEKTLTMPEAEFLADVFTILGLVYINQQKSDLALHTFERSSNLRSQFGGLSPDIPMSILYNKSVALMMIGRLEEAEENLRNAAAYFARHKPDQYGLTKDERKQLYI
ncbi:hypothetical protein P875_00021441 [Aspergillus parasiticus SU-1]|uniref:NACHT domain-containing protein n=1 Tax=Aspergillus parasiticus (strain ATCC 56775 / NRRL 5862 / SRRC 143 / SU-1) TaxID=1403190 RepID=A0A0F0IFD1_ASPPU|nr:hypothetical protein P875_00021441 [Aspergillus parasiticus SU-1]